MSTNYETENQESLFSGITSHLTELRYRFISIIAVLVTGTVVAFFFSAEALHYITDRFLSEKKIILHYFDLTEPFTFRLKLSFIMALFASLPFMLFHLWRFIAPALFKNETKLALPALASSVVLFYTGAFLSFQYVIPQSIKLLLQFSPEDTAMSINANNFLSFITTFTLFSGLIFELPVASFIAAKLGLIDHKTLSSKRKYAIVLIWVIAAVITPPDVLSQVMASIPMMLLYEISVIVAFFASARRRRTAVLEA